MSMGSVIARVAGATLVGGMAAATLAQTSAPPRGEAVTDEPDAGYVRAIGLIPGVRDLGLSPDLNPLVRPEGGVTGVADRGLPLGGFGAGSFEINQYGTFGPWAFGEKEVRALPQAAFHIREQVGKASPSVVTLATSGPLAALPGAWPAMRPGQANYRALYPFGWTRYQGLATRATMRFWSPIVAGQDEPTSMPVAYFDLSLANPTGSPMTVSVMFTFPNAPVHVPSAVSLNGFTREKIFVPESVRKGLYSRYDVDRGTGVHAVTLGASDPGNTVDAQDTEWTIGVRPSPGQQVSHVTSWNADTGAGDIMDAFRRTGNLPDRRLDGSNSAGAIAVSTRLKPGGSTVVRMILAWDVPRQHFVVRSRPRRTTMPPMFGMPGSPGFPKLPSDLPRPLGEPVPALPSPPAGPRVGAPSEPDAPREIGRTVWMKRYTAFFGGRETAGNDYVTGSYVPRRGFAIASRMLGGHDAALASVLHWWSPIAFDRSLPAWLRTASLDHIAYNASGNSFWEAGLVSNTVPLQAARRLGTRTPGTHMFFVATDAEGADPSALNGDVAPYNYLMWQDLFPNIERQMLLQTTEAIELGRDPNYGNMGSTDGGSPFVNWSQARTGTYIDHQILHAFRVWRFVREHGDRDLLRIAYPQLLRTYAFQKRVFFTAGNHLPVEGRPNNTHELVSAGQGNYDSLLWILNVYVMIEATRQAMKEGLPGATPALIARLEADLAGAQQDFEALFWDEARGYYRFDTGKGATSYDDGIFADAMYPQHLGQTIGIPSLSDPQHLARHLRAAFRYLAEPFRGADGQLVGAINMLRSDGSVFPPVRPGDDPIGGTTPREALEVWPGVSFPLAATMIATGRQLNDAGLQANGRALGEGTAHQIWGRYENGHAFRVPEAWRAQDPGHHRDPSYGRLMAVWDLLHAWRAGQGTEPATATRRSTSRPGR